MVGVRKKFVVFLQWIIQFIKSRIPLMGEKRAPL